MKAKVAINGFGRIGRLFCRKAVNHPELQVVAINASYDSATLAHLLKYDTTHGRFQGDVQADGDALLVDGQRIQLIHQRDASKLPWRELGVEIVIEATGKHKEREQAALHLQSGAEKVLITTASKTADLNVVIGVNERQYDHQRHHVVAAGSCTTNCLAPVAKVLHETFGIASGLMTTVHSYTNDQNLLDNPHKDLRRARCAAQAIIPTSTGAARAVAYVLPELAGKLNGYALRVPTIDVSVVDLVATLERPVTASEVNAALKAAAEGPLQGILGYNEEPLVSADFIGDERSAIVDALSTLVMPNNMVKVVAWYDNEWAYAARVVDLASHMAVARTAQSAVAD